MTTLPQCSFEQIPESKTMHAIPINQHCQNLEPFSLHGKTRMLSKREITAMQEWLSLLKELTSFKQVQKLYPQVFQLVFGSGCPRTL